MSPAMWSWMKDAPSVIRSLLPEILLWCSVCNLPKKVALERIRILISLLNFALFFPLYLCHITQQLKENSHLTD